MSCLKGGSMWRPSRKNSSCPGNSRSFLSHCHVMLLKRKVLLLTGVCRTTRASATNGYPVRGTMLYCCYNFRGGGSVGGSVQVAGMLCPLHLLLCHHFKMWRKISSSWRQHGHLFVVPSVQRLSESRQPDLGYEILLASVQIKNYYIPFGFGGPDVGPWLPGTVVLTLRVLVIASGLWTWVFVRIGVVKHQTRHHYGHLDWIWLCTYVGCRLPCIRVFCRQDIAVKHEG